MCGQVQSPSQNLGPLTSIERSAISEQQHQSPCNLCPLHPVSFMAISRVSFLLCVKPCALLMTPTQLQIQQTMVGWMIMIFFCLQNVSILYLTRCLSSVNHGKVWHKAVRMQKGRTKLCHLLSQTTRISVPKYVVSLFQWYVRVM